MRTLCPVLEKFVKVLINSPPPPLVWWTRGAVMIRVGRKAALSTHTLEALCCSVPCSPVEGSRIHSGLEAAHEEGLGTN